MFEPDLAAVAQDVLGDARLAGQAGVDLGAHRVHDPGPFMPGDGGKAGARPARHHAQVRGADAAGPHLHPHLPFSRLGGGNLFQFQAVGTGIDDGFHGVRSPATD